MKKEYDFSRAKKKSLRARLKKTSHYQVGL